MPHPSKDDYIIFLLSLIDEFQDTQTQIRQSGHPFDYETRSLICFFTIMILKRCFAFKAMNRWLKLNTNDLMEIVRVEDTKFTPPLFKHFLFKLKDGSQLTGKILDKTMTVSTSFDANYQILLQDLHSIYLI